jgi:adenine phosphoribosyltransferase
MTDLKTPENLPKQLVLKLGADMEMVLDLVPSGSVCFYSLNLLGHALINRRAAQALFTQMQRKGLACDVLVAAEAKAIGLIQELAMLMGHEHYVILRKSYKAYMVDPLVTTVKSITTANPQQLILDRQDMALLRGKTACFVDDVISTGATYTAAQDLYRQATGREFPFCVCVATEGAALADNPEGYIRLGHLPLFDATGNSI